MGESGGLRQDGITRRDALKRGAVVAGSALWVAPVVQALAVNWASAEQPSGGPVNSGRGNGSEPDRHHDKDPGRSGGPNRGGD